MFINHLYIVISELLFDSYNRHLLYPGGLTSILPRFGDSIQMFFGVEMTSLCSFGRT